MRLAITRSRVAAWARRVRTHVLAFVIVNSLAFLFYSLPPALFAVLIFIVTPVVVLLLDGFFACARVRHLIGAARVGDVLTVWTVFGTERPLALMALGPLRRARGARGRFGRFASWRPQDPSMPLVAPFESLRFGEAASQAGLAVHCLLGCGAAAFSTRATLTRTSWADVCNALRRVDGGEEVDASAGGEDVAALRGHFDAAARTVQRAWRRWALVRRRAARVIEDAVLHALYRPGGRRLGAVRDDWWRLAAPGPDMV